MSGERQIPARTGRVPQALGLLRLLQLVKPTLYSCLQIYHKNLISDLKGKHIALDSKRLRVSKNKGGYTHILSAWVDEFELSIVKGTVKEKRNELQAIPEVLDSLRFSGAVVSIDAMGRQLLPTDYFL